VLNPEIFRQYDIRGIAGKDMDDDDVARASEPIFGSGEITGSPSAGTAG
jgi:hypothetical protein